jgi:hypothetical protein
MEAGQINKAKGIPPLPTELLREALEAAIAYLKLNPYEYNYRTDHGEEWNRSQAWERWQSAIKAIEGEAKP